MAGIKVQIIHEEMNSGEYVLLSSFLRINGIIVNNTIVRKRDVLISFPLNYDYDFCVVIEDGSHDEADSNNSLNTIVSNYINGLKYTTLVNYCDKNGYAAAGEFLKSLVLDNSVIVMETFDTVEVNNKYRIEYLRKFVDKLKTADDSRLPHKKQEPRLWDYLSFISDVYGEYNLLRYRVALYSLYHRNDIVELVQRSFLRALSAVEDEEKQFNSVPQLTFFKVYAARFVNETCNLLDQPQMFNTDICVNTLKAMLNNPDCKSINKGKIYYLIATFFNTDRNRRRESLEYFEDANKEFDGKEYGARSLYQTARFYEKNYKDFEQAEKLYLYAHNAKPNDYKILYKLAAMAARKRFYQVAVMYYEQILRIFEDKKKCNRLEPREYEYLFKANHQLASIYERYLNDFARAEKYNNECKSIIRLADDKTFSNPLYEQIYGVDEWKVDERKIDNDNAGRFIRDLTSNRISRM